jgi:hypothetical protein
VDGPGGSSIKAVNADHNLYAATSYWCESNPSSNALSIENGNRFECCEGGRKHELMYYCAYLTVLQFKK